jgi:hypothetical protein
MKFNYAAEKFSTARSCLMLPPPGAEAQAIVGALHECSLGLNNLTDEDFPDYSHDSYSKLKGYLDCVGLEDPTGEGLWLVKAKSLTTDEKSELSRIIDELASWFRRADEE